LEIQRPHSDFTCVLRNGSPYLVATILGAYGTASQQMEFLVDTGFSGYAAVPDYVAQALSMPFWSFQTTRLADDTVRSSVECVGRMTIDGETQELFVSIMPDSRSSAVGMSFLRLFKLDMLLVEGKWFDLITQREQAERHEQKKEVAERAKAKAASLSGNPRIASETTATQSSTILNQG